MKVKKIKTTLLIAVLLASTIAGLVAMPTVMAATSVTADYVFEFQGSGEDAGWVESPDADHGNYVAQLKFGYTTDAADDYVYLRVYPELSTPITIDTLLTVGIPEFDYYLDTYTADRMYLALELTFRAPDYTVSEGLGWVDISMFPYVSPGLEWDETADDTWYTADGLTGDVLAMAFGEETDDTDIQIDATSNSLTSVISELTALDGVDGDWELTRVTPQIGWMGTTFHEDTLVWIDNVVVGDETYELEPQNLIVGESYSISWTTIYAAEDVTLLYDPEETGSDYVADIEYTVPTSSEGMVNFYNIVPHYAGNWTISYLNNVPATPVMDHTGLVKMSMEPGPTLATYFLVQPVEDYDVVITSSALDVESGTVALEVTVTDEGEPVADAYVSIEFWDNEAKHFDTLDTALLREYVIQTISTGIATFDIEVPEVAGTIYVTAGTDLGPEAEGETDDQYFEHWGYSTVSVSSIEAIDITVSPTSYTQGIPYDLNVTLANSPSTLLVLDNIDSGWINITISGDDIAATEVGPENGEGSGLTDADSGLDVISIYVDGLDNSSEMMDADTDTYVTGDVWVISCLADAIDKPFQIRLYGFKAMELDSVAISSEVDIGGVVSKASATLAADNAADGLADYLDTGAKSLTVTVPEDVTFVGLTPVEIPACGDQEITFTAFYYNGTDTVLATDFDVTLDYPTGRTYEGKTDGTTGIFSKTLDLEVEPYWADEAGTMTITVSGEITVGEVTTPYSGMTTIPVTGYLISTDMEIIVVGTENNITITVTDSLGTPINNAKVTMTPDPACDLTADEMGATYPEIDGASTPINDGLYVFHNVDAAQVCKITVFAEGSGARLFIDASNPVLDVSSTVSTLTNIVDNVFSVRVMEGTTPEEGATITMNVTFNEDVITTTNSTGWADIEIDHSDLDVTVDNVRIYVVSEDVDKTGELMIPVSEPVYVPTEEFYLTAGIDSEGNFTIMSADGEDIILVESVSADDESLVYATLNQSTTDEFTNGYLSFELAAVNSTDTLEKLNALGITVTTAVGGGLPALVAELPIYNPIVSNTTYTGFPITYTAYVGQTGNFYIKIQDASGEPVEGATVEIYDDQASGITNADGETTIMWTPTATGTHDIHLNGVLFIGNVTVESYVMPQLVVDYSPEIVYQNDDVTLTVTSDGAPVSGASVQVVDPYGEIYNKITTGAGTCTFTADEAGEWTVYASKTDYNDAESLAITVLELADITDISLSEGWNLVSLPLIPTDPSVTVVLADIAADVASVWSYDAATGLWASYSPGAPSDLTEMVDGKGYWMSMTASAMLAIDGTEMPVDPFDPLPMYPVVEGWNLIGFKETYYMTVEDYLAGVEYVRVYEFIDGYNALSATDYMIPGRGYWIAVSEPGTIYP